MPPKRQPSNRQASKKPAADPGDTEAPPPRSAGQSNPAAASQAEEERTQAEPASLQDKTTTAAAAAAASSSNSRPSAASVKRLDALPRPSPPTGGNRGRGGKLLSQPKFSGRRSTAARQELERIEADKRRAEQEARAAEDAAAHGRRGQRGGRDGGRDDGRGAASRGRGRGGYIGESNRGQRELNVASGPFSAGQANKSDMGKKRAGGAGSTTSGEARSGPASGALGAGSRPSGSSRDGAGLSSERSRVKQESGAGPLSVLDADGDISMDIKPTIRRAEDGGYISSDEDEGKNVERLNVENLTVIDLTAEEEASVDSYAPVRVARVAHKGRSVGINADGATNKDGNIAVDANDAGTSDRKHSHSKVKDVEIISEKQRFMSVYDDSSSETEDGPRIKPDPDAEDADVGNDHLTQVPASDAIPHELPTSRKRNRKGKERLRDAAGRDMPQHSDYQTQEEYDEWERYQRDLDMIRSELGDSNANHTDNSTLADTKANTSERRDNKVYLFQFPPILPQLAPIEVKPDVEKNPESDTDPKTGDPMQIDHIANSEPTDPTNASELPSTPRFASGLVGKLRVHASGRTTLDWGGTSLSVGMGAEATFLQDILIANLPETKVDVKSEELGVGGSSVSTGVAMSMGQVKGKFIVTPDWEEILR